MEVEGLDGLLKALEETSLNLVQKRKLIVKSLREAGRLIEEEGRQRIPVGETGAAKASMSTSIVDQTSTGAEAQIGPRRFYVKFEEFGTIHQTARPWLGPSFDAKEEEAVDKIAEVLGDGIEDAFYG